MIRVVGRSLDGVDRVWGEAETQEEAFQECEKAINEYVKRRPDCWPMSMHLKQQGNTNG